MEHSEADFTHGICPECLKKIESEMKAIADSEEPGTLTAEEKASRLPGDQTPIDRTSDRPGGKRKN